MDERRPAVDGCRTVAGPGAVPIAEAFAREDRGGHAWLARSVRRRSRQAVPRPKAVQFSLTQEEFDEVSRLRLRRDGTGAFAAEVTLAAARGAQARTPRRCGRSLDELMAAAGLVRRIGTNLNQAVARLNATGQRSEDLLPAAEFCVRVIRRLDEAAEQVRRSVP